MQTYRTGWPVHEFAPTIGADVVQFLCTISAECAFEAADEGARCFGRKVEAATLAIWTHLKHRLFPKFQAAALTASHTRSTTVSTMVGLSPSAMTRITGSVPDGLITRRPLPSSSFSAAEMTD